MGGAIVAGLARPRATIRAKSTSSSRTPRRNSSRPRQARRLCAGRPARSRPEFSCSRSSRRVSMRRRRGSHPLRARARWSFRSSPARRSPISRRGCRKRRQSFGRCPISPAAVGRGMARACRERGGDAAPARGGRGSARRGGPGRMACQRGADRRSRPRFRAPVRLISSISPNAWRRPGRSSGLPQMSPRGSPARRSRAPANCCSGTPEGTARELRENVTSRGGTTAAALDVLMAQDGLTPLIERAAKAAKERAEALSG